MIARKFHPAARIFPVLPERELTKLAADIGENGLRDPICLAPDGRIVDGRNRYSACLLARVEPIFQQWTGKGSLVAFIVSRNLHRRHLSISQRAVAAAKAKPLFEREARKRQGRRTDLGASLPRSDFGKSRDKAAGAFHVSGRSVDYGARVIRSGLPVLVRAVERGNIKVSTAATIATLPSHEQGDLVARGEQEILRAAKSIREQRAAANAEMRSRVAERRQPLPQGRYECIVMDPAWPITKIPRDVAPEQVGFDYPTMTLEEIDAFPVGNLADDDCHLFLWTIQRFMFRARELVEHWGFTYGWFHVWHKNGGFQPFRMPQLNFEVVIYARRGSPHFVSTKQFFGCFTGKRREHSRKPDEFYDMVRRVTAGPRLDLFSRELREGFDQWGNETGKFARENAA